MDSSPLYLFNTQKILASYHTLQLVNLPSTALAGSHSSNSIRPKKYMNMHIYKQLLEKGRKQSDQITLQ